MLGSLRVGMMGKSVMFTDTPDGYFNRPSQYEGGENWLVKVMLPSPQGRTNTKLRGKRMEEGGKEILPCSHESFLVE